MDDTNSAYRRIALLFYPFHVAINPFIYTFVDRKMRQEVSYQEFEKKRGRETGRKKDRI
jgi:hypothetical protein